MPFINEPAATALNLKNLMEVNPVRCARYCVSLTLITVCLVFLLGVNLQTPETQANSKFDNRRIEVFISRIDSNTIQETRPQRYQIYWSEASKLLQLTQQPCPMYSPDVGLITALY